MPLQESGLNEYERLAAVRRAAGPTERCKECNSRGWHWGDCHPRETCGVCDGAGIVAVPTANTKAGG